MTHADTPIARELAAGTWQELNELALWLHDQHEVEALQRGALERIGQLVAHRISMFDLEREDEHGNIEYVCPISTTMDEATLAAYYGRYAAMDYTTWSFDVHSVNVYRDLDLVDVERRDASPIFREWMEPQGIYFGSTLTLAHEGRPLGSVTLFREREAGDFTAAEMRALYEVGRHMSVRLAALLGEQAASGKTKATAAGTEAIEHLAQKGKLNPREAEVLKLMLAGRTNREMAGDLYISESTVKKHVNAVYHKLGVRNRMELANLRS